MRIDLKSQSVHNIYRSNTQGRKRKEKQEQTSRAVSCHEILTRHRQEDMYKEASRRLCRRRFTSLSEKLAASQQGEKEYDEILRKRKEMKQSIDSRQKMVKYDVTETLSEVLQLIGNKTDVKSPKHSLSMYNTINDDNDIAEYINQNVNGIKIEAVILWVNHLRA